MSHPFTVTDIPTGSDTLELHATFPLQSPEFLFACFTQPELVQQWWVPQRTVEIFFDPAPSGTLLRLTHGTYDNSARDIEDRENHRTGWHHFLEQLSRLPKVTTPVASEAT